MPHVHRFDVVDLNEGEVRLLAETAEEAKCASDLEVLAEIVGRLRLDGRVMDMAEFEALVLRGEMAPPPPDWLEFQRLQKSGRR